MSTKINVVFCIDNTYTQHLAVAVASLLMHNRAKDVRISIASSKLDPQDIARLTEVGNTFGAELAFHQITDERVSGFRQHMHLSRAAYYRILLPDILKEDKVIYLDCDIAVQANLGDLWAVNVEQLAAAGVDECNPAQTGRLNLDPDFYINSGILVLNLAYWRQHNLVTKCMEWLEANPQKNILMDQDAINVVLKFNKARLDPKWNLNPVPLDDLDVLKTISSHILHFGGPVKPWHKCYDFELQAIYQKYLNLTPWASDFTPAEPRNIGQACLTANQLYDRSDFMHAAIYYQRAINFRLENHKLESQLLLDCINGGHRHYNVKEYYEACDHYRSSVLHWGFPTTYSVNIYKMPGILDGVY